MFRFPQGSFIGDVYEITKVWPCDPARVRANQRVFPMTRLLSSASAAVIASLVGGVAAAQVDEIVVTATKRAESAQDVSIALNAIGGDQLDELGIDNFSDYLLELPNVTAGGAGPGQNTIYIRGLASTTPNLTTAGVAGLAPNVAFYLDEQPLAQPGRNLDVYAADLERIEVLAGPQGTLFGASSQAGTVRLITNKPKLGVFEAGFDAATSFTDGGEMSNKVEAVLNVPLGDATAIRGVVFTDHQGGYIDNVAGRRTAAESARFRPAGTVRDNGVAVQPNRAGFQSTDDLSNVEFLAATNEALVGSDFNDATYAGFRVGVLHEFTPDWRATVTHMQQSLEVDGVFFADPELDEFEVQRFQPDELEDDFHTTSWTLEGRLGALEAVYAGAYTERKAEQTIDYTDYLFIGQYLPYYICDGSVSYPGDDGPSGTCQAPSLFVDSVSETEVFTQELRFNVEATDRLRGTFGAFYSNLSLEERNDFVYPGSANIDLFGGSFPQNLPFPGVFQSDPGPFPVGGIFRNDVRRTDEQLGFFGEATFELVPDTFAVKLGARYYDVRVDLEGTANASFCNSSGVDENAFGTNISDIFDGDGVFDFIGSCNDDLRQTFTLDDSLDDIQDAGLSEGQANQVFNALRAPDEARTEGVIFKGTLEWTPTSDVLFYATYSEGFRPGLLNRPGGAQSPGGFTVPFTIDTDEVENYEIGAKTQFFGNTVRLNASAFLVEVSDLQTTILDPSITNLFFSDNAADAEIMGFEADATWAPATIEGLTVRGAVSFLDTEITEVITPTDDVALGGELAFAPSFQGNLNARYEWPTDFEVSGQSLTAHVMPSIAYADPSVSDIISINQIDVSGYTTLGLTAGVAADTWSVTLFGENLANSDGEIASNFVFDRERSVPLRPRTIGMRFSYDF